MSSRLKRNRRSRIGMNKIKRFLRRIEIENLMTYVAVTMVIVFAGDLATESMLSNALSFNAEAILRGEVWRIITFLFIPQSSSPVWIVFSAYFYYAIGRGVENAWGSHNLTMYFLTGWLMLIIVGFVTGYTSCSYLYFSLFLVYAALNPYHQFYIFMIIPVQARWMAAIDAVFMIFSFLSAFPLYRYGMAKYALSLQLSVVVPFAVYFIFFGGKYITRITNRWKHREFLHEMKRKNIRGKRGGRNDDNE